jgi:hypothetical protein
VKEMKELRLLLRILLWRNFIPSNSQTDLAPGINYAQEGMQIQELMLDLSNLVLELTSFTFRNTSKCGIKPKAIGGKTVLLLQNKHD